MSPSGLASGTRLRELLASLGKRRSWSIRGKMVALTVGLFLVFLWALVLVAVTVVQRQFDQILSDQQYAAARQVAAELDGKLQERLRALAGVAGKLPGELDAAALDTYLGQQAALHLAFSGGIAVLGLDGRTIADYPPAPGRRGAYFGDREYFRRVVASRQPHIDRPIQGRALKRPVLTMAVPVFDGSGQLRAVMAGIVDLTAPNFLGAIADRGLVGENEFFILSRQDNMFVAATDARKALAPLPPPGSNAMLDRFVEGFEGSGFAVCAEGIPRIYAGKGVPSADWVVVSALPTAVAFRPVRVMESYIYAVGALLTLLAIFLTRRLGRRLLSPLDAAGKAMGRMTSGAIPLAPLPVERQDEVGRLIGNFNQLVEERRRHEAALAESAENLRMLVDSAPDGIFVQTRGSFAYVNKALVRLVGADSRRQLLGMPCLSRVHPDSQAAVAERIRAINQNRQDSPAMEQKYLRLDGSVADVEVSAVPFRYQGEDGALVFVRDISARKKAERALAALHRDFVTLLENTSDFIYFKDRDSRFRFCSQTMARVTGHRHWRDMIGKHDLEVFPPDTAAVYQEEEGPIFREGKALLDRVDPYYDETGQPGWVSTNKWPVFGDDGETVVGIFGISRVVTERVRGEAALRAANRELQAFTYAASHDMKAPLGRINSFSALLERNYRDTLEGDGLLFLNFIRQNATRLTVLIEDLLAHSQMEQAAPALQAVDLGSAVHRVLKEREDDIRQAGARVTVDLPPGRIRADAPGLNQALGNLLENALKYSSRAQPPAIHIGARVEDGKCRLWVRDNGIGFDMQYHDRIFEIFRRLHTYDEFPGSGVGLALVRKAMERMGGRAWAESAPGEGATFYLELPGVEEVMEEEGVAVA